MKRQIRIVGLIGMFMVASSAHAYIVEGHVEATQVGLQAAGFGKGARNLAQISNYQVDYMQNKPKWASNDKNDKITDTSDHFHFQGYPNAVAIADGLAWLERASKAVLAEAKQEGSAEKVLNVLGITLHMIQDLYTHSNIPETDWTPLLGFPMITVESLPSEVWMHSSIDLHTDQGDSPASLRPNWQRHCSGGQVCSSLKPGPFKNCDDSCGINHDSAVRRRYLKSVLMATRATTVWALRYREWLNDEGLWKKVLNFSDEFVDGCVGKEVVTSKAGGGYGRTVAEDKDKVLVWALSGPQCEWDWQDTRWGNIFLKMDTIRTQGKKKPDGSQRAKFVGTYAIVLGDRSGTLTLIPALQAHTLSGVLKLEGDGCNGTVEGAVNGGELDFQVTKQCPQFSDLHVRGTWASEGTRLAGTATWVKSLPLGVSAFVATKK